MKNFLKNKGGNGNFFFFPKRVIKNIIYYYNTQKKYFNLCFRNNKNISAEIA